LDRSQTIDRRAPVWLVGRLDRQESAGVDQQPDAASNPHIHEHLDRVLRGRTLDRLQWSVSHLLVGAVVQCAGQHLAQS